MKNYFSLQFKMFNRKWIDFGVPLLLAYSVIPLVFILFSDFLLKASFGGYVYIFIALGFLSKLSDPKKNEFLKSLFTPPNYRLLRVIENLLGSLPFVGFLIYKYQHLNALGLVLLAIFMALFSFNSNVNFTTPTPFGKRPFEFTVGFRKTFLLFPITYFLTYKSISVNNLNLGFFSMVGIALICLFYYSKPEKTYFVWNFSLSPKNFLFEKIKTCCVNFSLLSVPIAIGLSIFFPKEVLSIAVLFLFCNVYMAIIVLAKYAAYPNEINFPQFIWILFSFLFPPIVIGLIPFFYSQSIKKTNLFLDD
jgi:hypothetical protein